MEKQQANGKNRVLYCLSLIGFFGIFSTTISKNPVLPYLTKSLGASDQVLGLISAVSPFAGIVFSFPVGIFADQIGKRRMLIISSFVFLAAPLLYILVSNAWFLIPIRFFHGIATAILGPVASAAIAEAYDKNKGEKLGTYSAITLTGRTMAPIVGGFIISLFSSYGEIISYKAVYAAAFAMSLPVVLFAFLIKTGETVAMKMPSLQNLFESLRGVMTNKVILATALADLSIYFSFGIFETFSPGYLKGIGYSSKTVGLIFSIQVLSIALTKPLFGKLSDRFDKRIQIVAGLAALALAIALLPFASAFAVIAGVSLLIGLGMSLATVATSAYVAEITRREHLGASMGALSSIMDVGHSGGPLIAGLVIGATVVQDGFLTGALLGLVVIVLFLFVTYRR